MSNLIIQSLKDKKLHKFNINIFEDPENQIKEHVSKKLNVKPLVPSYLNNTD